MSLMLALMEHRTLVVCGRAQKSTIYRKKCTIKCMKPFIFATFPVYRWGVVKSVEKREKAKTHP